LIKVSKDVDSSLVSNKNFSDIRLSNSWAQVRYQQSKIAKNLTYDVIHKKTKPQNFFVFIVHLPSLLRIWTALQRNWLRSYVVGKPTEMSSVFPW